MTPSKTSLAIKLTECEKDLVSRIDFSPSTLKHDQKSWLAVAEAMHELMASLLRRNAIPETRWKTFTDPEYFIGGHGLSHYQTFEKNGIRKDAIFRHPHFAKFLWYFLFGPDLPQSAIDAFQNQISDCGEPFTSQDALKIAESARSTTRLNGLDAGYAAEEFYKLALESGLDVHDARVVRDKAKGLRNSSRA